MSSVTWQENRLIQRAREQVEELGYVAFDQNSNTYVLWLKDTCDAFGLNGGYLRGDEFPTLDAAKQTAAFSMSARLVHHMWMVKLGKESRKDRKYVQEWIDELQASGEILSESSFLSHMKKMELKKRKFSIFMTIFGVIFGILLTLVYEHSGIKEWIINFRGIPY